MSKSVDASPIKELPTNPIPLRTVVEALMVRRSVLASPIEVSARKPADETWVVEAVIVRRSVEASPIKESAVEPKRVREVEADEERVPKAPVPETVRFVRESPVP